MKEEHKKKVRKSVLNSKAQLEEDLSKQLKQYGIFPDRLVDVEKLDLTGEKKQKRKDLEEILEKIEHKDTGDKTEQEYYVRKAAYTYFNRLAALKLMESHSLLDNVITPNSEFGNQPELLFHYKDITDIQNEDTLYESYFTGIFNDLDQEIGKIFDMDDQTSLLFPSSNAVDTVIEELDNIPQEAWKEEEIIGWMYQYFISEEKDDAFDKLNNDNQKINGSTLPAVTSLYTPHWIVEYLVDNTLGVMWKEMHPDTDIDEVCDYIVPDQEFEEREPKDIEEITLLDPACGSGHFLLYAFDVFYEMYKEEGYDEEEIPQKILENNLYGIDVDNRSSQLSALALYVKAKELTPDAEISQLNIISADAVLMNGEKKEKLLEKCRHDIEEEVIEEIWDNFQHLDERGSLVKIEEPVREKITEYKNNLSKEDKDQQLIHQFSDETRELQSSSGQQKLAESVSTEEYWDIIEEQMIQKVQELGQEAIQAQDMSEQLFASETEKTLHLLDYLMADYDCVVANPPYGSKSNLESSFKSFLSSNYPDSANDLYSAFIRRNIDFAKESGKLGLITQDTFMFLKSYTALREKILPKKLNTFAHLGTHAFEDISGEKVRTVAYTFDNTNNDTPILFYDLTSSENKKQDFESGVESKRTFKVPTEEFEWIAGSPLVYNIPSSFREHYTKYQEFGEFADPVVGMKTSSNKKYLRYWWEIGDNERWKPIIRETKKNPYFHSSRETVDWSEDAVDHYNNYYSAQLPDEKHRFTEGIAVTAVSKTRFDAQYVEETHITDMSSHFIFPKGEDDIKFLLGWLNSSLVNFHLNLLNPTINYKCNDIEKLPFKPNMESKEEIVEKVEEIEDIIEYEEKFNETIDLFENPLLLEEKEENIKSSLESSFDRILKKKEEKRNKINRIDKLILNEYGVPDQLDVIRDRIPDYTSRIGEEYEDLEDAKEEEVKKLLSYFIQVSLGRWEMEGVEPADDGILMVSTEVSSDSPSLMDKIRECIAAEWGQENVSDIESEINNILYHGMEKWIKKYFFKNFHYKMYNKRPVVWEIKTPNDHFKAFIYYHELDEDTLPKLQVDYIEPLMTEYNNRKNLAKENGNTAEAEKLEDKVEDLRKLKEQLDEVIEEGYSPDLDEGVKHNFKPVENMTSKEMK